MGSLAQIQIEAIQRLARDHGVADVRVFGSMARGTATESSDLDLLVRFEKTATLIEVIGFKQAVEEKLGIRVDVVEEGGLSRHLAQKILDEAILL